MDEHTQPWSLAAGILQIPHAIQLATMPSCPDPKGAQAQVLERLFIAKFYAYNFGCRAALKALENIYNARLSQQPICVNKYYVGVYRILCRTKTLDELLPDFITLLPQYWQDRDRSGLDSAIRQVVNNELELLSEEVRERTKEDLLLLDPYALEVLCLEDEMDNDEAVDVAAAKRALMTHPKKSKKRTMPDEDVDESEGMTGRKQAKVKAKRTGGPLVDLESIPPLTRHTDRTSGWVRTRSHDSYDSYAPENTIDDADDAVQLSDGAAANPDAGLLSPNPNTTMKKGSKGLKNRPTSQIIHFGPVFASRRAVLSHTSRPYIHAACGKGYMHPNDVFKHHNEAKERSCVPVGNRGVWNEHESCKISLKDINYTKLADDQFVILDQESLDMVNQAVTAGKEYKMLQTAVENGLKIEDGEVDVNMEHDCVMDAERESDDELNAEEEHDDQLDAPGEVDSDFGAEGENGV